MRWTLWLVLIGLLAIPGHHRLTQRWDLTFVALRELVDVDPTLHSKIIDLLVDVVAAGLIAQRVSTT